MMNKKLVVAVCWLLFFINLTSVIIIIVFCVAVDLVYRRELAGV